MRVLLLYRKDDRSVLEVVAHHLTRCGYQVVLDVKPGEHETLVDAVRREIALAQRVVIAWSADVDARGTLREMADVAGQSAKLIVATLDLPSDPLHKNVRRVPLVLWDGDADAEEFLALRSAIESNLAIIPNESFEMFQGGHPRSSEPAGTAVEEPVAPSPTYVPNVEPPTLPLRLRIAGRLSESNARMGGDRSASSQGADNRDVDEGDVLFSMGRERRSEGGTELRRAHERASPADATAFAPRKFRRATPELLRIVVHKPEDLRAVELNARAADSRTAKVRQPMALGVLLHNANLGVSVEVAGAANAGGIQRATWHGNPVEFSFAIEPDAHVHQVVVLVRVYVNDAQIGVMSFSRPVTGKRQRDHRAAEPIRLKRHKRVFLSYSSEDRKPVAAIAVAYYHAGVEIFWDRKSLESGEEWPRRLRRELDRCDLFHLCWSQAASKSEWVEREALHAINRRRRSFRRQPAITVQMLDGPPWAPHSPKLDSINFDDFVRAAVVGYAQGDQ